MTHDLQKAASRAVDSLRNEDGSLAGVTSAEVLRAFELEIKAIPTKQMLLPGGEPESYPQPLKGG